MAKVLMTEQSGFDGAKLRDVRRAAGLSLNEVTEHLPYQQPSTLARLERGEMALDREAYFGALRAIGKAYRERAGRYRQEDAAARKVS